MHPPSPENGKAAHPHEVYGHSRKLNSYNADTLSHPQAACNSKLFPPAESEGK